MVSPGSDESETPVAPSGGSSRDQPGSENNPGRDPGGSSNEPSPRAVLIDIVQDPDSGAERLPYLIGLFESDDPAVRALASAACALIAIETEGEEHVEYLVRRLTHRLADEQVSLELTNTLDYLSSRYPDQVSELLGDIASESREAHVAEVGNFTRSHYYGREHDRGGVGRTRMAGEGDGDDPRVAYANRREDERFRREQEARRDAEDEGGEKGQDDVEETQEGAEGEEETFEDSPGAILRRTQEINRIASNSRFEQLHVRGERYRTRYADVYEVLVGSRGDEAAIALGLLHRPEDNGDRLDFDQEIVGELKNWDRVDDHEGIVTVHDWALEPRPWLASDFFENSLATRRRVSLVTAVREGLELADAVSHIHQRDVVHGAIDPKNVVYPMVSMNASEEFLPRLTNVSLIHTYKTYFSPGYCLDPRYAAPEYYDSQFGNIDHSTDIYHLGAVCYRLCTGRHPYRGGYEEVRHTILEGGPPRPSAVAENVPKELDQLVAKAMARQKLRRYETVEHFHAELRGIEREYRDE